MQQVKILRGWVPPSLPDAGYFKPGEGETLAAEALGLRLLPGESGGDWARVWGTALGGRSETQQCDPRLCSLGEGFAAEQPAQGEEWPCPAETETLARGRGCAGARVCSASAMLNLHPFPLRPGGEVNTPPLIWKLLF